MKPLVAIAAFALASPALAGPPASTPRETTSADFETRFRQAELGSSPTGPTRGTVLHVESRFPRVKARLQGVVWKGKTFHDDGTFTNRWLGGVRAVSADTRVEPSWLDGQPCLVMQYPPNAPVFGNIRDELRQIAPGVWLGRSFDGVTGRPKNWFLLRDK